MSAKFFLDTNIIVYSFDTTSSKKCKRARELLAQALTDNSGIISYQVVQEFINFALRISSRPMTLSQCHQYFLKVLKPLCAIQSSAPLYLRAFALKERTGYSWYDSLIVASAIEGSCEVLYSEDLQDTRNIDGVLITNPFA